MKQRYLIGALVSQYFATGYVASLSILVAFVLGRLLGPKQFGTYSYVLSLASIFFILQEGGFRTLLFREGTSKSTIFCDKHLILRRAIGHVIVSTIVGFLFAVITPISYSWAITTALLCFGLSAFSGFISSYWKSEGRFDRDAAWQVIVRTLTAGSIILALAVGVRNISIIFIFWSLGIGIALLLPLGRMIWQKPLFHIDLNIFKSNAAFLLINAATAFYFRCDIVLLKILNRSIAEVGEYAAAFRIFEGMILLITPLSHIGFRYLRLSWQYKKKFHRLFLSFLFGMLVISVIFFAIVIEIGDDIIQFTFGFEFKQSESILLILSMALFFVMPNSIITQAIVALNLEKAYAYLAVAAAVLNLIGNFFMIPIIGAKGAAISTVITEGFLLLSLGSVYFHWYTRKLSNKANSLICNKSS